MKKSHVERKESKEEAWRPPLEGGIKANFNAFIQRDWGTRMGVVFKNHNREVIVATTTWVNQDFKVLIVEALAFRWSIEKAKDLMLYHALFETNYLELVSCWKAHKGNYLAEVNKDVLVS